jgi:hypothetical protein
MTQAPRATTSLAEECRLLLQLLSVCTISPFGPVTESASPFTKNAVAGAFLTRAF